MRVSAGSRADGRPIAEVATVVVAAVVIAALAVHYLRDFPYPLSLTAAWRGAAVTAAATGAALLRTWGLLAIMLSALAGWLRRRMPDLSVAESVAGAVVLFWSGTYFCLLALGPFGLFQPGVLRALLVVVLVLTLRPPQRRARRRRWPSGAWIALGALALTVVPLLLLQLGSPVSPFMDTLPQAASPERMHLYQPPGRRQGAAAHP